MKSIGARYPMINFRASKEEYAAYKTAAKAAGHPLSKWIRLTLNKAVPAPEKQPEAK